MPRRTERPVSERADDPSVSDAKNQHSPTFTFLPGARPHLDVDRVDDPHPPLSQPDEGHPRRFRR